MSCSKLEDSVILQARPWSTHSADLVVPHTLQAKPNGFSLRKVHALQFHVVGSSRVEDDDASGRLARLAAVKGSVGGRGNGLFSQLDVGRGVCFRE
jgi:hypothetical protein